MTSPGLRGLALGDDRFFCRDGLLELWLAILVDRMGEGPLEPWQESLIAEWRSQATVRFSGVMTSELDRHLDGEDRISEVAQLCDEIRGELAGGVFEPGPLARRVMGFGVTADAMDAGLLRIADSMLWLLGRGRNTARPGSESGASHYFSQTHAPRGGELTTFGKTLARAMKP